MIVNRLNGNPVVIQLPVGEGPEFEGIIDLVKMELVTYGDDLGSDCGTAARVAGRTSGSRAPR